MAEFDHGKRPRYFLIWVWLAVLTLLEVGLTYLEYFQERKKLMIAVLVTMAIAKAMLVALYFMHLRYEWASGRIIYLLACAPFILVVVMTLGLLPDIGEITRFLPF